MEYRNLGASGLKVPVLSFGAGTFGTVTDQGFDLGAGKQRGIEAHCRFRVLGEHQEGINLLRHVQS